VNDHVLRREAVEQAYRDHADDVYRIALAILHDPDAAVDATHDTFARAFERWEQYDANRPLRAWLHGIVSHAALDQVRRQTVRTLAMPIIGRVLEMPVTPAGDRADPALQVAQRDLIAGALAGLKPDARAALVLRHYYGDPDRPADRAGRNGYCRHRGSLDIRRILPRIAGRAVRR